MAGDAETGMMVMKMDKGLDTGPVALTRRVAIGENMTAGELHDALMRAGGVLMTEAMGKLEAGDLPLTPQAEEGVLYAAKIDKAETRIDFSKPATDVHNHIRGLSPFPGTWFELQVAGKPERVKVLASGIGEGRGKPGEVLDHAVVSALAGRLTVACGEGAVDFLRLQKAGGKLLDAADFLRGTPVAAGEVLA
jgi:methionyl-tRNA formyltransferase